MSTVAELEAENARLRQENDRLRAENTALRPLVASLRHDVAIKCRDCDYMLHDLRQKRGKDRANATTRTYTHG